MTSLCEQTIRHITQHGKGILAADESTGTITKRFAALGIESTEANRAAYRSLLAETEGLEKYIGGVILFEETLTQQNAAGLSISKIFADKGIAVGIKVDKGLIDLAPGMQEKTTQGLDGLAERLAMYKEQGACFAKWRVVFNISATLPSTQAVYANAELLARYAAVCQSLDIVPIVEPEVLMDGAHTLARCEEVTHNVLQQVFIALERHKVKLQHIILKPNMVIAGQDCPNQATATEVAQRSLAVLLETVPAAVPTINFLSGGQSDQAATQHLALMNQLLTQNHNQQTETKAPWVLSFSYGRALQAACLKAWAGQASQVVQAQQALLNRAQENSAACLGKLCEAAGVS